MSDRLLSLEYIAGYFDGEGYIGLHKTKSGWYPRAVIVQKHPEVLLQLQRQFGGAIYTRQNGIHQLNLYGMTAFVFIEAIEPHLWHKREQAKTFLESYQLPACEREELSSLMKDLKRVDPCNV